jgi:hypothetical protein
MRQDIYGSARPDVFSITKTLRIRNCRPTVHEVKVTKADFQSDIRSKKWEKYRPICQSFYFVVPMGLIDKSEIPPEAGLLAYDSAAAYKFNSFVELKRPRLNKEWKMDEVFLMRLILGRWGTEPSNFRTLLKTDSNKS